MLIAIEFNVPMQVILKLVKFSANVRIELVDDLLEEIGEEVFATEEKRRRDATDRGSHPSIAYRPHISASLDDTAQNGWRSLLDRFRHSPRPARSH